MEKTIKLPEEGFVRLPQILQVIPVCSRTWYRGVKKGEFPQGIRITGNVVAWDVSEIRKLIRSYKPQSSPQLST